jgi:glyoxylase-like metal-dependent hydrolase (beta-lactamase superfamily II)
MTENTSGEEVGRAVALEPGLRMILAPNPSPMTHRGTNTYLIGERRLAVIDPGPDLPAHEQAILDALLPGQAISHILVTHSHLDHSALASRLSERTGAPVLAFGPSKAGQSPQMAELERQGSIGGGEGVDATFAPHRCVADGERVEGDGWQLHALWTPGHMSNHMSFAWRDALFTGDLVMGWATSIVSPPDGDLSAFMHSCRRLRARSDRVFYPGHGDPVTEPAKRLDWLIRHREEREAAILGAIAAGATTIPGIRTAVYGQLPEGVAFAAERNILAHLLDLHSRGMVEGISGLLPPAEFLPPGDAREATEM